MCLAQQNKSRHVIDGDLANWFETGYVFDNFRTVIPKVIFPTTVPDIAPTPIIYSSESKYRFISGVAKMSLYILEI